VQELLKQAGGFIALGLEAGAMLLIAVGAMVALIGSLRPPYGLRRSILDKKEVWLRFGVWLLLGLEFELAADIIRSAIAPTWAEIGQLAAIAVIRTFLNYFLEQDLDRYIERERPVAVAPAAKSQADPVRLT
jgi:uncharacterized membrane protein